MKTIRNLALSLAIGMLALSASGQDAPAPEQRPEPDGPAAGAPPAATPPAQAPPSGAGAPVPSAPQAPRRMSRDDEFIPSEELSADEEVTFPVDI
jgi:hypothetical protein